MSPPGGSAAGASGDSACCQIPGFPAAAKAGGAEDGERRWWRRLWDRPKERHALLCGAAALLVLAGGVMSLASALTRGGRPAPAPPTTEGAELPKPWDTVETNVTLSGKLHVVPRREWLAQPPLERAGRLRPPVALLVVSHSATEPCDTQAACTHLIRFLQTFHIESSGWTDIVYNFLVGGDGSVYEGRGWASVGAHAFGYNNCSLGLDVVGTFSKVLPSQPQILALQLLIEFGVKAGYIAQDYKLLAHRQLSNVESPGARFYEELRTWPHWSADPGPACDTLPIVRDASSLE